MTRTPNNLLSTIALTIVALCMLSARSGHADPLAKPKSPAAHKHLRAGNTLLELQKYDEAITAYRAGYLIESAPIFLYNLALAHRNKGELKSAIEYYENFLHRARNARPDVHKAITKLVDAMRRDMKKLERAVKRAKVSKPVVQPRPVVVVKAPPPLPPRWYSDRAGWAMSSAGVVVAGLGLGLLASSASLRSDAERELVASRRDELHSQADSRRSLGLVFGIAGAVGVGAGVVKLIIHRTARRTPARKVDVALGPGSISVVGRF